MWGSPATTPAFGTPSATPTFGTPSSTPAFATPSTTPAFGTPSSTPVPFATPSTTPAFGSTPTFATPSSTPAFSAPSLFGPSSFLTPSSSAPVPSLFSAPSPFPNSALFAAQAAPAAPLLVDRDVQALVDAYKDEPANPKYSFRHLLFSVTDPAVRAKPLGVSDIMWAEAMGKLEGMDAANRERLWPQLMQGFKDLSNRLKLQDEVMVSDADRLKTTQKNVKMLQRHFQVDTLPRVQRLRQQEQNLQRRLLRVMRIVEALEGRGLRLPLMRSEVELHEKLQSIARQMRASGNGYSTRVRNLLSMVRMRANAGAVGNSVYLPGSTKIDEQSLADLQEVLQQQTEAISKIGNVLKKDARDVEIILSEGGLDASEEATRKSS